MDYQHLSKRLEKVADYIKSTDFVADIGSDHAYLPAFLVINRKIPGAIAGEVVQGPYESAQSLVKEVGLSEKIFVRLGDGLDVINPTDTIDAITICGMGGVLIRDILARGLSAGTLMGHERLVLQPNVGEAALRLWLMNNHYAITDEEIIGENQKFYEIIVAEKTTDHIELTKSDITFGPFLRKEQSLVFKEKWQQELNELMRIREQLQLSSKQHKGKVALIEAKIKEIKEVLQIG
ncbi:tRNA (adenine(22)-N(1))-methyltransferase [Vagococcus vulneris]|uniref:SAM-dependent methyltransferase n=1 Tax=Vagococcus vulneris TaxID=1977869 RepID=A0A430A1Y0_9ENTE|nr:tRNA (adenine(22)-N(1))-methyltransferase TrmK [Vagococcus vulneris]RSU00469.1 SAM-dependent methyltransferase [Vagococcus vulneris]